MLKVCARCYWNMYIFAKGVGVNYNCKGQALTGGPREIFSINVWGVRQDFSLFYIMVIKGDNLIRDLFKELEVLHAYKADIL